MPKDRVVSDWDHRLWNGFGKFSNAGAKTSAKQNDFHLQPSEISFNGHSAKPFFREFASEISRAVRWSSSPGSRFHAFGLLDLPSRSCRFLGDDLHQTGPLEAEVTT
jgi:hypothetical protein